MISDMRVIAAHWAPAINAITSAVKVPAFQHHQLLVSQAVSLAHSYTLPINAPADHNLSSHRRFTTTSAASSGDGATDTTSFTLIVYSKQNCPLCDKLKEKLEAIMDRAAFMPSILSNAELEIRDISTNPAWLAAYSMSVPVLAVASPDGTNEVSCSSERLTTYVIMTHLEYLNFECFSLLLNFCRKKCPALPLGSQLICWRNTLISILNRLLLKFKCCCT
jgi:glutaredoxin